MHKHAKDIVIDQAEPSLMAQDCQSESAGDVIDTSIDIERIESLGKDVIASMRSVRELLDARAVALEACRTSLEEHYEELAREQAEFEEHEAKLCEQLEQREGELADRESRCQAIEEQLTQEKEQNSGL